MKLRLENKSVKFRLSKEDIIFLQKQHSIEENIIVTKNNSLTFKVEIEAGLSSCKLDFILNGIIARIPIKQAEKWANSNQIGIKETIVTETKESITLIVEEDLPPRKSKK